MSLVKVGEHLYKYVNNYYISNESNKRASGGSGVGGSFSVSVNDTRWGKNCIAFAESCLPLASCDSHACEFPLD